MIEQHLLTDINDVGTHGWAKEGSRTSVTREQSARQTDASI
jgi:hypothetical protein